MAKDNELIITAGLDVDATVSNVENELQNQVNPILNKDRALKIICNIDLSKTTKRIQSQLDTLSKNLIIKIPEINFGDADKSLNGTEFTPKIKPEFDKKSVESIKKTFVDLTDAKEKYRILYGVSDKDVSASWIKDANGKLSGFSVTVKQAGGVVETFNHTLNETGKVDLKNITGSDKGIAAIANAISKAEKDIASFKQSHASILSGLSTPLQEVENALSSLKNGTGSIEVFDKALNSLKAEAASIGVSLKSTGSSFNIFDNAANRAENFENELKSLKMDIETLSASALKNSLSEDIAKVENGFRELQNIENNIGRGQEWADKYGEVSHLIQLIANNLKIAQKENSAFAKEFEKELKAEEKLAAIEEKRVTNAKALAEEQQHDYWQGRFEESIKGLTAENQELKQLKQYYKEINDAAKEFEKTKSNLSKNLNSSINKLNTQSNKSNYFKNSSDPSAIAKAAEIDDLRTKYQALQNELQTAVTPESLVKIKQEFDDLVPEFDKVISSSKNLQTSLKNDSALETHRNKVEKLSATMKAFAQANEKAVKSNKLMSNGNTFADEWQKINDIIAKGSNLSANELKHLQERFNTFGKEAEAAGLKGASAWDKFLDSFKTLSTYVSASRVLSFITGKIRETITELQTVNDVLTEISKTSDRTDESLRKLGDNSFDSASKYGRKSSDYLFGVQEMSRAGFGDQQSEELAELSILAQAAGDMTSELSNKYLIATDSAYKLKGNVEELTKVLDGQNYITNKNALNMEDLAQATKVAASQASSSGLAVDELTAAIGTMVATTQESGDVAGRAFKGILMNLQQVKADADEIGDGGEAITTESLSKYEEATKALGVSLKEVKNGVWELREPMQILKELSQAVNKESEGSVKVANLINAVGGKFRGNQLIALLKNWETYEKMLSEFNSNDAVGSAMEEAEKSANNWSGSLNKLSNSWAELVNQFINSDNMIESIQSVDKIVQDLTDSSVTGALGTLANMLTGIIKLAGNASDKFGTIPTLLTTIAGISAFKGVGKHENYIPNVPIYAPLQ